MGKTSDTQLQESLTECKPAAYIVGYTVVNGFVWDIVKY